MVHLSQELLLQLHCFAAVWSKHRVFAYLFINTYRIKSWKRKVENWTLGVLDIAVAGVLCTAGVVTTHLETLKWPRFVQLLSYLFSMWIISGTKKPPRTINACYSWMKTMHTVVKMAPTAHYRVTVQCKTDWLFADRGAKRLVMQTRGIRTEKLDGDVRPIFQNPYHINDQNLCFLLLNLDQNGWKVLPFRAAHTYMCIFIRIFRGP